MRTFDQLGTRLKVGDTVWVTDASGREVRGKIEGLGSTSLTLSGGEYRTFQGSDVRAILDRPHDSLKFGTLLGLGIGVGTAVALLASAPGDVDDQGYALGIALLGGCGAGIGAGIDAMIPMPKRLVYRAPSATGAGHVSLTPIVGRRSTGVAVAFRF